MNDGMKTSSFIALRLSSGALCRSLISMNTVCCLRDSEDKAMKDRTNKEKPLLGQTIECVGMMYHSLQSLCQNEYPRNPMMFAIMAQGPVSQIRDLLDDVEWLMEDMVPRQLREQADKLIEAEESQ